VSEPGRLVRLLATNYDGTPHWSHPTLLVIESDDLLVAETSASLEVMTERGPWTSPFATRGYYWRSRWYNVIRLEEPGYGLNGWYCNIAMPAVFDGATLSYVDMQLDVRVFARSNDLEYELWDEEEFEAAHRRFGYPVGVVERCRKAVGEVIALVESRSFPFDEAPAG
jgi:protein associated with RNAse G/E